MIIGVFVVVDLVGVWWFLTRGLPRIRAVNTIPDAVVPYQPTLGVSAAEPRSVFVGGGHIGKLSVGGRVVRLQVSRDGLRLGPRWDWLRLIPRVDLRWDEIDRLVVRDGGFAFTRVPAIDVVTNRAGAGELIRFTADRSQMDELLHQLRFHRPGLIFQEAQSPGGQ